MTTSQKGRIFISYRRADSAGYAGRIFDRLSAHFGKDAVFMDVDTIEAGLDFVEVLQDAVQACDVLVALIGRQWIDVTDETGKRRLDNPEDFVRVEIGAALSRDIRVIPVLVDGGPMPRSTELPGNLKPLARRNALQVDHHSFNADANRLISQLELALRAAENSRIVKARRLQEEGERKEREAREAEESKRIERREQEERARLAAEERARKEREVREKAKAEDQKYLQKREKLEQRALIEKLQKEKEERERKPTPDALASQTATTDKFNWRSYNVSGIVFFALVCLVFGGILIYPAIFPEPATTITPETEPQRGNELKELGVGSTMVSEKDGMVMVYVPAGEFRMGSEDGDDDERPVHTVYLDAYWIDQTEVTNAIYSKCVDAGECNQPYSTGSNTRDSYYGNSNFEDFPVIYVSWHAAAKYCTWAGRRLPTEAEWEKAASWDEDAQTQRAYPWGDAINESYANYNQDIGDTIVVANYENNVSFYGAYDIAGNVWEWVADRYNGDYYESSPTINPQGPSSGSFRVMRGGSWYDEAEKVRSASRLIGAGEPLNNFGFRCARDAE